MINRKASLVAITASFLCMILTLELSAGEALPSEKPVRKPFGIEHRVLWKTSHVQGTPDPPKPYQTELAFPHIRFNEPLAMTTVPGTNWLAIAERGGKIFTFKNDPQTKEKHLLVDVGRTVYGLAFHPKFAENGYVYASSVLDPKNPSPKGSRVSRFHVAKRTPQGVANSKSETVLLEWISGGHNGGCLNFGPDGFLYLSCGDGSGIADLHKSGQDLSDFAGSILRIDVDHPANGLPYGIPKDNPFVHFAGARPEVFSYGHRQLWKFSFDTATKTMWGGEIGQDLWEMIYIIHKGGNYGWSVMEGTHPFRPERKKGPTPFIKPIVEHSHNEFRSITGGYIYHSPRLKNLAGAYIYGDYDTGRIWSFRYDGKKVTQHQELADTQLRIVEFGQDTAGEVFLVDFVAGGIHRLVPAPPQPENIADFPRKLSETGLFSSTVHHQPAPGLIPYSVNAPLYSDNAVKDRFIALRGDSKIEFDAMVYPQPAPGAPPGWRFPDGSVLVKTFSLEMETGNPQSLRRLETRILHHERMPGKDDEYGAQVWRGYTYVWNEEQTDALLLDAGGLNRTYTIKDSEAPGGKRQQTWRFPSRAECTLCHTMSAKYVLGVNTLQLNKDHNYDGVIANQLKTLDHLGVFTEPLKQHPATMPRLADYKNLKLDIDVRARSYLHANCSECHRKWGGGNAEFQLLATLPLAQTETVGTRPGQGKFDLDNPRLLVPGNPERSMIYYRMTKIGLGRMPHVGSNVIDHNALELIAEWIRQIPQSKSDK